MYIEWYWLALLAFVVFIIICDYIQKANEVTKTFRDLNYYRNEYHDLKEAYNKQHNNYYSEIKEYQEIDRKFEKVKWRIECLIDTYSAYEEDERFERLKHTIDVD